MAVKRPLPGSRVSFDVTATIGTVFLHVEDSEDTPYEAALRLIGKHGAPGAFRFPAEDGGDVEVTVVHTGGDAV